MPRRAAAARGGRSARRLGRRAGRPSRHWLSPPRPPGWPDSGHRPGPSAPAWGGERGRDGGCSPPQPQARRHGHGQGHPDPFAPQLEPECVRWHRAAVHCALLDAMAVPVAAVVATPCLPRGPRSAPRSRRPPPSLGAGRHGRARSAPGARRPRPSAGARRVCPWSREKDGHRPCIDSAAPCGSGG